MSRVERWFDFLCYHFKPQGIISTTQALATGTIKALRLHLQEPPYSSVRRLVEYLRRWQGREVSDGFAGGRYRCRRRHGYYPKRFFKRPTASPMRPVPISNASGGMGTGDWA
jgi:hypothetical protein